MVSGAEKFREGELCVAPNINLYYRDYGGGGQATPVVCLHGYWRTSKDFEELAAHLAPRRRVITPDLRGRGRSSWSQDSSDYEFDRLGDDILALLRATGVERAVFVGLALGAQLIMDLAARAPEHVAGIVLNDSAPETVAASGHRMAKFSDGAALTKAEALDRIRAQYSPSFPRMGEEGFQRLLYRNYKLTDEGLYVRDFDQLTNQALVRTAQERPTFWREYEAIPDVPLAILCGANSDFIASAVIERMLAGRRRARVHKIPDCGHPAMLWEPEVFSALDELLGEVDAAEQAR